METNNKPGRIHPLVATAAGSVIVVSMVGVAAITGILPNSHSTTAPAASLTVPAAPAALVAPVGATTLAAASPSTLQPAPTVEEAATEKTAIKVKEVEKPAPKVVKKPAPVKEQQNTRPATNYAQKTVAAAPAASPAPTPKPSICYDCGRIEAVQVIQQPAQGSGVGVVAGAVLGGVLGNQVGGGNGKKLATVAGVVGGGFAGNEIEKRARATTSYQVEVRMEDGSFRSFTQTADEWRVGDRVKVVNGTLTSRG